VSAWRTSALAFTIFERNSPLMTSAMRIEETYYLVHRSASWVACCSDGVAHTLDWEQVCSYLRVHQSVAT
jgi:hypothetical protein